jgi:hypothetical protein
MAAEQIETDRGSSAFCGLSRDRANRRQWKDIESGQAVGWLFVIISTLRQQKQRETSTKRRPRDMLIWMKL